MQRAAVVVIALGLSPALSGCPQCPRGTRYCDGDKVMGCTTFGCVNCAPTLTVETDCKAEGDALGVPKTCRDNTQATNSKQRNPGCVDAQQIDCPEVRTNSSCDAAGHLQSCTLVGDNQRQLDSVACPQGTTCAKLLSTAACVDAPLTPCDAGTEPWCSGDSVEHLCWALEGGGGAVFSKSCGSCLSDGGLGGHPCFP